MNEVTIGARVGMTSVLHTWGSALTHHPHIHMILPGGGLSPDGRRWVACKPGFFLHVRVLSRLFRRLFLEGLMALHRAGQLRFFGDLAGLADTSTFVEWVAPLRKIDWVVYAKPPFGGPEAVLAYLSRYTHRVAISNHRLVSADANTMAFQWKDYRIKRGDRMKVMRLATHEFIRRFLMHVLPDRFHRIRHYGFLAGSGRKEKVARIRDLLGATATAEPAPSIDDLAPPLTLREPCPNCGGAHAHHRDLPARTGPQITCTTPEAGRMMQCPFSTHAHDRLAPRQRSTVALGIVSEAGPITVGSIYHPQVKPSEALRILGQATSHNWQATAPSPRSNSARDTLSP